MLTPLPIPSRRPATASKAKTPAVTATPFARPTPLTRAMTPPSPDVSPQRLARTTVPVRRLLPRGPQPQPLHSPVFAVFDARRALRRPSGSLQAVEGGLDGRFALVDDRRPAAAAPVASPHPALRFLLPALYVLAALLLVLTATGTAASGYTRPARANELVMNVTAQLAKHLEPIALTLENNIAHLAADKSDLAALAAQLDRDEAARTEIKAKLRAAIAKVDLDTRTERSSPPPELRLCTRCLARAVCR
jgi:hypothetical protein